MYRHKKERNVYTHFHQTTSKKVSIGWKLKIPRFVRQRLKKLYFCLHLYFKGKHTEKVIKSIHLVVSGNSAILSRNDAEEKNETEELVTMLKHLPEIPAQQVTL